jgi:hypothetical protein
MTMQQVLSRPWLGAALADLRGQTVHPGECVIGRLIQVVNSQDPTVSWQRSAEACRPEAIVALDFRSIRTTAYRQSIERRQGHRGASLTAWLAR